MYEYSVSAYLVFCMLFFTSAYFFSKESSRNIKSLKQFGSRLGLPVGPDLFPNCLQRFLADDKSCHWWPMYPFTVHGSFSHALAQKTVTTKPFILIIQRGICARDKHQNKCTTNSACRVQVGMFYFYFPPYNTSVTTTELHVYFKLQCIAI